MFSHHFGPRQKHKVKPRLKGANLNADGIITQSDKHFLHNVNTRHNFTNILILQ